MSRNEQEPKERPGMHARHDDESKAFTHPAFGQIGANRVTGGTTLYGSDFIHHNFVTISIHRSELHRDLSHDWHYAGKELIEVRLSEAQWATFVSSMNNGMGVPCTLARVAGEYMPDIPLRKVADVASKEMHDKLNAAAAKVEATIEAITGELGAAISGKKRAVILAHLAQLRRDLDDSLPFAAKSFEEHMETTVEKAKVEVNAYMQATISRAGLTAIANGNAPLQLGAGKPVA